MPVPHAQRPHEQHEGSFIFRKDNQNIPQSPATRQGAGEDGEGKDGDQGLASTMAGTESNDTSAANVSRSGALRATTARTSSVGTAAGAGMAAPP